jgi:regulatory protein
LADLRKIGFWFDFRRDERAASAALSHLHEKKMDEDRLINRVTEYAYRLLAAKPRSEKELRDRLVQKKWDEPEIMLETVDKVILRLKELRYINDGLFAYDFVKSKVSARPIGKARISRDLMRRKVSREAAAEAISLIYDEATEDGLIDKAIERRLRIKGMPTSREESKKLFDHLMRLGFSYDLINTKLRAIKRDSMEDESV